MLSAGYYPPGQLFPLTGNRPPGYNQALGQGKPKLSTTTTTTTTTARVLRHWNFLHCYTFGIGFFQPQTVEWTLDWGQLDQITSRPSRRPRPPQRSTTRRPRRSTRRPKRTTRRPRPQEDYYSLENEDNNIGAESEWLKIIIAFQQHPLTDYLFNNGIDYDFDDDDDTIEENQTFSDIPISTVTPADIEGRLRSLEEIFKSLHVSSDGCQKMLVCHLSKESDIHFCLLKYHTIFIPGSGGVQPSVSLGAGPTGAWHSSGDPWCLHHKVTSHLLFRSRGEV